MTRTSAPIWSSADDARATRQRGHGIGWITQTRRRQRDTQHAGASYLSATEKLLGRSAQQDAREVRRRVLGRGLKCFRRFAASAGVCQRVSEFRQKLVRAVLRGRVEVEDHR
jgi:hypothetical protein